MQNEFKNKIIAVTGGTGAIGSNIVYQLLKFQPKQIRVISRDENKQYYLMEKLKYPKNLRLLIGDIRDRDRLELAFKGADIVFHAAALKHVPLCEYNPLEAVKTNIIGSQNVIDAALKNEVKKVIAISTDKAVNPVNILGTSKLMMEKLFINESYYTGNTKTRFCCVRFGNVTWSRGSVLPLWKKQSQENGIIKITDGSMTRFFMSTKNAVQLVLKATEIINGGEIFILKMPSIKLDDMADLFINKYHAGQNIKTKIIGKRPGEKQHEELFDDGDLGDIIFENEEMFIITPRDIEIYNQPFGTKDDAYYNFGFRKIAKPKIYSSEDYIDINAIEKII